MVTFAVVWCLSNLTVVVVDARVSMPSGFPVTAGNWPQYLQVMYRRLPGLPMDVRCTMTLRLSFLCAERVEPCPLRPVPRITTVHSFHRAAQWCIVLVGRWWQLWSKASPMRGCLVGRVREQ